MSGYKRKTVATLAALALFTSGCATTPDGQQDGTADDQQRTRVEGAAIGAVLGGLLGAALGDQDRGRGAVIGAAVGAGAGYLVGNEVAKRKRQYANEEEFLDAEIHNAGELNATASQYNAQLRTQVAGLEDSARRLRSEYAQGAASRQRLEEERSLVQQRISSVEKVKDELQKEYEIKVAVYEEQQGKRPADDPYVQQLRAEINQLKTNLDELNAQSQQLAQIDERLTI
jgi:chromosome segregation ATPase